MSTYGTNVAYRIQVEGLAVEFVSHSGMEQTLADGRQRVRGLDSSVLAIDEEADIVRGEIESGGFSVRVVDRWADDFFTDFFVKQPDEVTWLTAEATKTATTFTCMDSSPFTPDTLTYAYIGTETVEVTDAPTSTTLTVTRGIWDSVAQAHYVGVGEELHLAKIGSRPTTIEGRRVRLFRYEDGDDPQGDGSQIYLGVAVSDAQLESEGSAFSFRCDPITSVFKTDLASDIDKPAQIRGVSYHATPFHARIWETTDTAYDGDIDASRQAFLWVPNPDNAAHVSAGYTGFFETQEDFVQALNLEIQDALTNRWASAPQVATSAGFGYDVRAFVDEATGKWGVKFRTSGTPRWFRMQTLDQTQLIEGDVGWAGEDGLGPPGVSSNTEYSMIASAPGTDRIIISGARVPRGLVGIGDRPRRIDVDAIAGEKSPTAFYLNNFIAADVGDELVVKWNDGDALEDTFRIIAVDSATRRVNGDRAFHTHAFTPASQPEISIRRNFARGHVGDFMRKLAEESPSKANAAAMPLITGGITHEMPYDNESGGPFQEGEHLTFGSGETAKAWVIRVDDNGSTGTLYVDIYEGDPPGTGVQITGGTSGATADTDGVQTESTEGDTTAWTRVALEAANGRPPLLTREYASASEIDLAEMLSHEFRLLGVFPRIEGDGRVGIQRIRLPIGVTKADFALTSANILVDESPPEWERNAYGSVNTIEIKTRYWYREDEHRGTTHVVRDVTAWSTRKQSRKISIEPKSVGTSSFEEFNYLEAVEVAQRLLGIYGQPYSVLTIEVDSRLLTSALVGSVASITSHRVPNVFTGSRGVSGIRGLVIGRSWDLARGRGLLKILVSDADAGGYTPNVTVSGDNALGGDQYELTVSYTDPAGIASTAPEGSVLSDFYDVNFALELHTWDSTSYTSYTCTVDAVDDDAWELTVTFDTTPTISGTQFLSFAQSAYSGLVDTAQSNYAFYAQDDGRVDFNTEEQSAKEYGA